MLACALGAAHAGSYALNNQCALELRKHTEHLKQCPAGRRRRIDCLPVQVQVDFGRTQLIEEPDQVLQRAS